MGGGTDVDAAFEWMCNRAGKGDFLVIRASGSDAYNPYVKKLCPQLNSVETIIITSVAGANSEYVKNRIRNAEALWIAGGDQSKYVKLWRGTAVQAGVNYLLNSKRAPVGGTSAGLAVLSEFVYTGSEGSVRSAQALADPFHAYVTLERSLFKAAAGKDMIFDSHFVSRDRMGRSLAFLARIAHDRWSSKPRGVGVADRTAILVEPDGIGTVVGEGAAYFFRAPGVAEMVKPGFPLTYLNIKVHKVLPSNTFDFSKWIGGVQYSIAVKNGVTESSSGSVY
jgi:cyanophycinase